MLALREFIVDVLEGSDLPKGDYSLEEIAERLEDGILDLLDSQTTEESTN